MEGRPAATANHGALIQILGKKLRIYADYLTLTRQLKHAIAADDMARIDELTRQREDMMVLVNRMDRQIQIAPRDMEGEKKRSLIMEALDTVLRQIIESNNACETAATAKCEAVKRELLNSRRKGKAKSGYAVTAYRNPKFLDVRT
ncbi:MAG: hypothetical protein WC405_17305 [Syntrophales bacterium]